MQPKNIYISGKITGLEPEQAAQLFEDAEAFLKTQYPDVAIVNPFTIEHNHDLTWESYMRNDLIAMLKCDTIYMLKNWKTSKGANIEYKLAVDLNFNVLFQYHG